jgi:CRISPR-associated exonuclease Cas4
MTSLSITLLILAGVIAALGGLGFLILWRHGRATGFRTPLGGGTAIVASDTGVVPALVLRDPSMGLRGKPDYVLEQEVEDRRALVPLELKPARRGGRVYESDAVQVGAYVLLLRAVYGDRAARFGYVRYSAGTFRIELTADLERRVRGIVAAIRSARQAAVIHRSHAVPAKCANCAMRPHCDESLV